VNPALEVTSQVIWLWNIPMLPSQLDVQNPFFKTFDNIILFNVNIEYQNGKYSSNQ